MSADKHERLAEQALELKKAWIIVAAILGAGKQLTETDLTIPHYRTWENKRLKRHIADLESAFKYNAKHALLNWKPGSLSSATAWFAARFDDWQKAGFGLLDLGRLHEVEQAVGLLGHRKFMDCPPYAQVVVQALHGAAIRHPEYHLATDVALLYNLLLDAEAIIDEAQREGRLHTSEHSQSLARNVILACFNLLESFISGLAVGYLLDHPNAPAATVEQLQNDRLPLRKRFLLFPSLITGRPGLLDGSQAPLKPLFDECKPRRDSFVHCEPGSNPTKRGYVKEEYFHDVELPVVRKTVDLTWQAICLVWKSVHSRAKPSWLPERGSDGRFPKVSVSLRPLAAGRSHQPVGTK